MAATEDISFRVALDDGQAQAGLEGLRTQATGVAVAADGAAGGVGSISKNAERLNNVVGPASTAISGLSGAIGGVSSSAGSAVGAVGNLASAMASGGPLAVAIAGIGLGVGWLTSKYQESARAAKESERAQKEAAFSTAKVIEGMTRSIEDQIATTAGYSQAEAAVGRLRKEYEDTAAEYKRLKDIAPLTFAVELKRMKMVENTTEGQKLHNKLLNEAAERQQALGVELNNAEGALEEYNQRTMELAATQRTYASTDNEIIENLKTKTNEVDRNTVSIKTNTEAVVDADGAAQVYYGRIREQLEWERYELESNRVAISFIKEKQQALAEYADSFGPTRDMFEDERESLKKRASDLSAEIQAPLGMVVDSSEQLMNDLITGQDKAFERFAANIMRQAGTVMVGKGIETTAIGIANLAVGNPGGAAQIATGGALIVGGMALGGAATGIEHVAIGGGQLFQALPEAEKEKAKKTPMGAGRISTGSVGDGGPGGPQTHTYVFNAPVFGDQNRSAKHVALLQRRARRDLLMA